MLDYLRDLHRREPARTAAFVVSALVAVCSALGIVVDEQSVGEVVAYVLPILAGGEATRRKVRPVR
ncbi:MAG: hypothetical protein ACREMB_21190 [Candidatus Rokuibacteriota bacterium]